MSKQAREVALDVLLLVDKQEAYSNLALQNALRRESLIPPDAALCTEIVYGTLQRLNTIDAHLRRFVKQPLERLEDWVRNLLRLSVYQLLWLDRVPDFAIIHEAVELAKRRKPRTAGLINAVLRAVQRHPRLPLPERGKDPAGYLSLSGSHPEWMVRLWLKEYGYEETERMCRANNGRPRLSLRVNPLRTSRDELITKLHQEGIGAVPSSVSPFGIRVEHGGDVGTWDVYRKGLCSVQDESAMLVAPLLHPSPGMRVLDACAAPGGKTTQLAEAMNDKGEIVAVDLHAHKGELIRAAAQRLGLRSIQVLTGDIRALTPTLGLFDAILLDAPCSGLGVIRRKPELKWRKTEGDIATVSRLQRELLHHVAAILKPGGILVYSTCTVVRTENQQVVDHFLQEEPFQVEDPTPFLPPLIREKARICEGMVQILPQDFESDGFFMVRMRKK